MNERTAWTDAGESAAAWDGHVPGKGSLVGESAAGDCPALDITERIKMNGLLLVPVGVPILAGLVLLISSFRESAKKDREGKSVPEEGNLPDGRKVPEERNLPDGRETPAGEGPHKSGKGPGAGRWLTVYVSAVLAVSAAAVLGILGMGEIGLVLFPLVDGIPVFFRSDALGGAFAAVVSLVWAAATVYAFPYMAREGKQKRYFGFWLLLYGILIGLDFSGNLVTMYFFYELMTFASMPLVMHNGTKEAVMAGLKYLFYSLCGAYGGLLGLFFLCRYSTSLTFTAGGTLDSAAVQGHEEILLAAVFVMLLGFGAKAGMLPLHAWLPTAHPVAPSPASAVLSAVIVKSGVLAVIRTVYYVIGADFLKGTWVQQGWIILSLLTVFMGSLLAFREQGVKKRLAYSTVSQVSYIMFGLALLNIDAFTGALLHVAVHAFVKCGLFLTAGIFLHCFGQTKVGELAGAGKRMPWLFWCYTILALALTGIPPTGGFISKWYLAEGALASGTGIFSWLGPVVLLVSALLTAGYLLPIALRGFFPGTGSGQGAGEMPVEHVSACDGPGGSGSGGRNFSRSAASLLWGYCGVGIGEIIFSEERSGSGNERIADVAGCTSAHFCGDSDAASGL